MVRSSPTVAVASTFQGVFYRGGLFGPEGGVSFWGGGCLHGLLAMVGPIFAGEEVLSWAVEAR